MIYTKTRIPPSQLRSLRLPLRSKCLQSSQHRTFTQSAPSQPSMTPPPARKRKVPRLDPLTRHRLEAETLAARKRQFNLQIVGVLFGMIGLWITCKQVPMEPVIQPQKADALSPGDRIRQESILGADGTRKAMIGRLGAEVDENADVVATGTEKIPTFPRQLAFVDDEDRAAKGVEYQLVGLGVRTVSFLGIEVYVVGMYVAKEDIAVLQKALMARVDGVATTLVPSERETLRGMLLDHGKGEEVWGQILKENGIRSLLRIVPTRDTDFAHMRDAWVRHLTARARSDKEYEDESFGVRVQEFKTLFQKGKSVPKGKEMLLARNAKGALAVWYDDGKSGPARLGGIADERVSRGLWLNYLAGKNVASEPARKNIVEGCMGFVERPVGTVATQVLVDPTSL